MTILFCFSIRTLYNKCEGDDETILLVKSSVGEVRALGKNKILGCDVLKETVHFITSLEKNLIYLKSIPNYMKNGAFFLINFNVKKYEIFIKNTIKKLHLLHNRSLVPW